MSEIKTWDARREIVVIQSGADAVVWGSQHWIHTAQRAIQQKGRFVVALSGGSTPKAIYQQIARVHEKELDWTKVWLFWSDERAVKPDHPESNYKMAEDSGLLKLPIPSAQVFRMHAEAELEKNALDYERIIRERVGGGLFDLVMLGVGEDGHTASLFPHEEVLKETKRLVRAVYVESKKSWRMTLTFACINASAKAVVYALGPTKAAIVPLVLGSAVVSSFPASAVGTAERKALWVMDGAAAQLLK